MDHCGVPPSPSLHNDTLITDSYSKENILNDYFTSVFVQDLETLHDIARTTLNVNTKSDQHQDVSLPTVHDSFQSSRMEPITICPNGIFKLLSNLKPGKASGPDDTPARFLRDFATPLTPSLTLLLQASLDQHKLPSDWKHAKIAPVFKNSDQQSVTNYHLTSLTSTCSKLLEHIIAMFRNILSLRSKQPNI